MGRDGMGWGWVVGCGRGEGVVWGVDEGGCGRRGGGSCMSRVGREEGRGGEGCVVVWWAEGGGVCD